MDSNSDNGSDDSDESFDGVLDDRIPCTYDLKKLETTHDDNHLSEDASATLEWSQFMNSTEGMLQYMEEATATIEGVSGLVIPSPREEQRPQHGTSEEVDDHEHGESSAGAPVSPNNRKAQTGPTTLPVEALPHVSCADTTSFVTATEPSKDALLAGQLGLATVKLTALNDSLRRDSSAPDGPGSKECRASEAKQAGINESDAVVRMGIPTQPPTSTKSCPLSSSSKSPGGHAGLEPQPDTKIPAEPPIKVSAAGLLTSTPSNRSTTGDTSVQNTPFSLVDGGERNILNKLGFKREVPLASCVFKTSLTSTSQQGVVLVDQVESELVCFESGIPDLADFVSQIDVIESVAETEVARRIVQEKARYAEARQQRRKDSIAK